MRSRISGRALTLGCHFVLLAAIAALVLDTELAPPWRMLIAVIATSPLLLALPSLIRERRRAYPWLGLALVLYAGAAVVEVVASAGAAYFASIALLAALLELALLIGLIRGQAPSGR